MSRPPKRFEPGDPVWSLNSMLEHANNGGWFFAFGPRPQHPSVLMNQRLTTVLDLMQRERLRYAQETDAYRAWAAQKGIPPHGWVKP